MRTLRLSDLSPGVAYLSPSGRLCRLIEHRRDGNYAGMLFFAYVSRRGKTVEDGFRLDDQNATAIAAMKLAVMVTNGSAA